MKQTIFNRTDLFLFLTRAGVLFQDIIQLTYDYTRQQTRQDGQKLIDPATGARANFTVYNDYKTVCDGLPMVYSNLHMGMSISSCVFSYTTNQMFFYFRFSIPLAFLKNMRVFSTRPYIDVGFWI